MISTREINELEKKLFRYRLKRKLKSSIVLFFIISAITVTSAYIFNDLLPFDVFSKITFQKENNQTNLLASNEDKNLTTPSLNTSNETPALHLQLPAIENIKSGANKEKSSPSSTNSQDTKKNVLQPHDEELNQKRMVLKPSALVPSEEKISFDDKNLALLPPPPPLGDDIEETKPKGFIKIESQEIDSIAYLKDKFEKTHNITFALMLSEEFYLKKDYIQSNKWALIANNMDSENEKSWIWFAKSKAKMGQKEDAILALKTFLKSNKSKSAQNLLNQLSINSAID